MLKKHKTQCIVQNISQVHASKWHYVAPPKNVPIQLTAMTLNVTLWMISKALRFYHVKIPRDRILVDFPTWRQFPDLIFSLREPALLSLSSVDWIIGDTICCSIYLLLLIGADDISHAMKVLAGYLKIENCFCNHWICILSVLPNFGSLLNIQTFEYLNVCYAILANFWRKLPVSMILPLLYEVFWYLKTKNSISWFVLAKSNGIIILVINVLLLPPSTSSSSSSSLWLKWWRWPGSHHCYQAEPTGEHNWRVNRFLGISCCEAFIVVNATFRFLRILAEVNTTFRFLQFLAEVNTTFRFLRKSCWSFYSCKYNF